MAQEPIHPHPVRNPRGPRAPEDQPGLLLDFLSRRPPHRWQLYLGALALVAVATVLSELVGRLVSPANLVMIYLLAVVLAAVFLERGPAVLVSILGVLAFDFFVIPPRLTFAVADTQYLLTFLGLLVVSLVISQLTASFREQLEATRRREGEMELLYSLSRDLAVSTRLDKTAQVILNNIRQSLGLETVILLASGDSAGLQPAAASTTVELDRNDLAVAEWVYQHRQTAERRLDAAPEKKVRWLPLKTASGSKGVIGLVSGAKQEGDPAPAEWQLLESFASLAALAIERAQFEETARSAELLQATEKLQSALLNSISHDLRTPLVSITGVLSSLQDEETQLDPDTRSTLIETARGEADRLNQVVGNLLDMTRIQAGTVKVTRQLYDVQDLIGAALEQLEPAASDRPITIDVPADMPAVSIDFGLMVQALVKLVENAHKYSPPRSPIEIRATVENGTIRLEVADRGIGIPESELRRIFDKFYRARNVNRAPGMGLGLSISRGIVEAHGGKISAENRAGGGTIVRITLPRAEGNGAEKGAA